MDMLKTFLEIELDYFGLRKTKKYNPHLFDNLHIGSENYIDTDKIQNFILEYSNPSKV